MKINFETKTYASKSFEGEVVSPHFASSYFGLTADSFVTMDREDAGGAVKLSFCMKADAFWEWFSSDGKNMAELNIPPALDLRGERAAGVALRDVIQGGVLVVKTPAKTHQIYLGEKARGTQFAGDFLTFTERGEYQVMFLFSTWYRFHANMQLGLTQNQYHVFSYNFQVDSEGNPNHIDSVGLEIDEVLRGEWRTAKIEVQKRSDDFYYWKNCTVENMTYNRTNSIGQKFFDVTYLYGGNRKTETIREDLTPNFAVT